MRSMEKKTVCPCCGKKFKAKYLLGYYGGGARGLDLNPHIPELSDSVLICPHCSYAATDMNGPIPERKKELVLSAEYRRLREGASKDPTAVKIYLAAYLHEAVSESKAAADLYILGHWYAHDAHLSEDPFLEKAIDQLMEYLRENADVTAAMLLVDCLRQAGAFDEAHETAESLLRYLDDDRLTDITRFELKLIENRDPGSHLESGVR